MKNTFARVALTAVAAFSLASCGDRSAKDAAAPAVANTNAAAPSRTLAAMLQADGGAGALTRIAANSGLDAVLEGVGPYTVLAPSDAALGQTGADLTAPASRAQGAALLRAHILPGALTRADIAAAVDRSGGQGAQVQTMAGVLITFTRDGQTLIAAAPDGVRVRLSGQEALATNGVLQPIDGLLVKTAAP